MLTYRWFAKTYGWTPEQVRECLTEDEFEWIPKVETAAQRALVAQQEAAQREARASQRRSGGF